MTTDSLPVTVLVPENAAAPIEVYDQHAAFKLAVVERDGRRRFVAKVVGRRREAVPHAGPVHHH